MIKKSYFGTTKDGGEISKYTLTNSKGMSVDIINFGAIITSIKTPDRTGKLGDVVLAYQSADDYFEGNPYYFGAVIGRYGNRIAYAEFELDSKTYKLEKNNGCHNLHSGKGGFHNKIWHAEIIDSKIPILKMSYVSPDGEGGFPGNLEVCVIYTLKENNELEICYQATTDQVTVVNMTQHTYFNLSGNVSFSILNHELKLNAEQFIPTDETNIPFGHFENVVNTPFDFKISKTIGKDITAMDEQIKVGFGYDHTFVIPGEGLRAFAEVYDSVSGRILEVKTTEPGVQFYTGNHLDGSKFNQEGNPIASRTGFCLETQKFPDSPNQRQFPTSILKPGELYESKTVFKFSVK